jgi:hypothetical protein
MGGNQMEFNRAFYGDGNTKAKQVLAKWMLVRRAEERRRIALLDRANLPRDHFEDGAFVCVSQKLMRGFIAVHVALYSLFFYVAIDIWHSMEFKLQVLSIGSLILGGYYLATFGTVYLRSLVNGAVFDSALRNAALEIDSRGPHNCRDWRYKAVIDARKKYFNKDGTINPRRLPGYFIGDDKNSAESTGFI